jgi:predicted MFS family arabinose efflux permease
VTSSLAIGDAATLAPRDQAPRLTAYAWFVLSMLVAVYTANFADRYIFIIMMEPIKRDLGLTDTQLGIIGGVAFSAIYSFAGLAVARWADMGNRRSLIAAALALWSALTAVCGLTAQFGQLLIARMGVGVAESACSPPAYSLIADYFPQRMRALAFSVYSVGLSLGLGIGFIAGGWIGERYGWRAAFLCVGIPGVLLAVLIRALVREPLRGASDGGAVDETRYSVRESAVYLLQRPSLVAYMLGSALFVFAGTALDSWGPLFLMRVHGLSEGRVGLWTGILGTIAGLTGALAAGWVADRLSVRDLRWHLWVALAGVALEVPATLMFLFTTSHAIPLYYFASVFLDAVYMPPTLAITLAIMPVRLRAISSAVLLLGYNLIGIAGCNFVVGYTSDRWASALHVDSIRYALAVTQLAAFAGVICTLYAIFRLPRDFREHFRS